MKRFLPVLCGLLGAALGWLVGGRLAPLIDESIAILNIAGIRGMPAWGGAAELGAGLGLLIGVWAALRFIAGHRSFGAIAWRGLFAVVAAGVVSYGALKLGAAAFSELGLNATVPTVEFEIRLPVATSLPASHNDIQVELHTDKNQIIATLRDITTIDGRAVMLGTAPLVFRTTQRTVILSLPGETVRIFRLLLQASPAPTAEFGPWQQVDYLDQQGQQARRTDVTEDYSIRYRVR